MMNKTDRRIVAVCIGPDKKNAEGWKLGIPLHYHQSEKHYFKRGSKERVKFTAENRNAAMEEMLRDHPDCSDVLMIDDYYLHQSTEVARLLDDYMDDSKGPHILGGGTWTRDVRSKNKIVFWDCWATPECSLLPYEQARGIHRASGIGACYLFPMEAWNRGARYGCPEYGTDHLPFHQAHGLPLWIDLDVKLWHPPNVDAHAPLSKKIRIMIGPRRFLPFIKKNGIWWYRGFNRNRSAWNGAADYERWIREFITFKGRQFVEVGANVGMHTIRAAPRFKTVVAFEPEKEANRILRRNVRLNKLPNVAVFQCAIMDFNGNMDLNIFQHSTWNSFYTQDKSTPYGSDPLGEERILQKKETVQVRKLDEFTVCPSLLMIDVEGSEEKVLAGAEKTISLCQPEIIIEVHSNDLRDGCLKILDSYDYSSWVPKTVLPEYIIARPHSKPFSWRDWPK